MFVVSFILTLLCLIAVPVGLIEPSWVVRWGKHRTRWRVLLYYGAGAVLCYTIVVITGFDWTIFNRAKAMPEMESPKVEQPAQTYRKNADGFYLTNGGYLASSSKELYERASRCLRQRDFECVDKLIGSELVFELKKDIPVYVEDSSLFGGWVRLRPKGYTFDIYTNYNAIYGN